MHSGSRSCSPPTKDTALNGNLHGLRVIGVLAIENNQRSLQNQEASHFPSEKPMLLSLLLQLPKIPGGMNIYYFSLISGVPRRSAQQLNSPSMLLSTFFFFFFLFRMITPNCTSEAQGLFFKEASKKAFLSHDITPEAQCWGEKRTPESCSLIASAFIFWQTGTK